jgi:hypothetical protein
LALGLVELGQEIDFETRRSMEPCESHLQSTFAVLGDTAGVCGRLVEASGNEGMGIQPCPGFEQPVAYVGVSDVFTVILTGLVDPVALVPPLAMLEVGEHQQGEVGERNPCQLFRRVVEPTPEFESS